MNEAASCVRGTVEPAWLDPLGGDGVAYAVSGPDIYFAWVRYCEEVTQALTLTNTQWLLLQLTQ